LPDSLGEKAKDNSMESFSQRKGLKPIKSVIQIDSMDDDLRNGLWTALTIHCWNRIHPNSLGEYYLSYDHDLETLVERIWMYYFKKPIDTLGNNWLGIRQGLRDHFYRCSWNEVYDFVEFVANNYPDQYVNSKFITRCNFILERELSAYRLVGGKIAQITSEEEIGEIEKALKDAPKPTGIHLKTALDLLADRKSPDYRNSMKESISAVEAICKLITGDPKAKLGQALNEIEKKTGLHPALKKAFSSLYDYTSDAQGIRHALKDESNLYFEDAKFMLVSCSAFINYLMTKSSKAGIKF
jgi:hypothetical protein